MQDLIKRSYPNTKPEAVTNTIAKAFNFTGTTNISIPAGEELPKECKVVKEIKNDKDELLNTIVTVSWTNEEFAQHQIDVLFKQYTINCEKALFKKQFEEEASKLEDKMKADYGWLEPRMDA